MENKDQTEAENINTGTESAEKKQETTGRSPVMIVAVGIILFALVVGTSMFFRLHSAESGLEAGSSDDATIGTWNDDGSYSEDVFAMKTYMNLKAYGDNAQAAVDEAAAILYRLDRELSVTNSSSDISKLNSRESSTVCEETFDILRESVKYSNMTEGYFDISVYPLVKAWGFINKEYRVPERSEIDGLLTHVGRDKYTLSDPDLSVTFADDQVQLDTGAIAKGYAAQKVYDSMKEQGITSGISTLGGTVIAMGSDRDGSDWKVGIVDPSDTSQEIAKVKVCDKFLVTSGAYEQHFEQDGKTYHHIIDPFTGYPADSDLASITIISDNGTASDAFSTALFAMGMDKAADFWRSCSDVDFQMVMVTNEGKIYATEGLKDTLTSAAGKVTWISKK